MLIKVLLLLTLGGFGYIMFNKSKIWITKQRIKNSKLNKRVKKLEKQI